MSRAPPISDARVNALMPPRAYHPIVNAHRPLPAPLKAALGAGITAVLLLGLEAGLRVAGVPDPGLYQGDPAWLWTLRPGLDRELPGPDGTFRVRTNALGLRGVAPPVDGPWTLVLGCSTTFGWGVEDGEAWPARLGTMVDTPVVNGGVPGWSTVQAVRGAGAWLDLAPTRVILAYGVRDAWPAPRGDAAARQTHPLLLSHLGRALRGFSHPRADAASAGRPAETGISRVPPADFARNTRALVERAGDAEVVLLWFPQAEPRTDWRAALEGVGRVIAPELPQSAYFASDAVHLTAEGHALLADAVARSLSGAGSPVLEETPPPRP